VRDRFADLSGSRYLEPEIETMARDRLQAVQGERALHLVPYVYERSALHRRLWREAGVAPGDIRSLEHHLREFARLATLSLALRPTALYCLSDAILQAMAALFPKLGIDPAEVFGSYRGLVFAGEPLTPRLRALVDG
jgi:hypothetical protein